jgi:hypothetical protein
MHRTTVTDDELIELLEHTVHRVAETRTGPARRRAGRLTTKCPVEATGCAHDARRSAGSGGVVRRNGNASSRVEGMMRSSGTVVDRPDERSTALRNRRYAAVHSREG